MELHLHVNLGYDSLPLFVQLSKFDHVPHLMGLGRTSVMRNTDITIYPSRLQL